MNKKEAIKRLDALDKESQQLKKIIQKEDDSLDSLTSYASACKILGEKKKANPSIEEELKTIIKAANYRDNGNKIWKPDFTNADQYKYFPYFRRSSSGWLLDAVHCPYSISYCPGGSYFKEESTARIIAERFLPTTYTKWLNS